MHGYNTFSADQMLIDDLLTELIDSTLPQDAFTFKSCMAEAIELNEYEPIIRRIHASMVVEYLDEGYCLCVAHSKAFRDILEDYS